MTTRIYEMREGFETAFVDGNLASNAEYRPSFVSNKPQDGKKVISSIEDELLRCEEFQISVAFVTMGGITPLLLALKELEKKGVQGKILTTNYLNFSEPRALEKLNELTNIELRMYDSEAAGTGFHTKGYIFRKDETYRIITGSSNLTKTALTSNVEWNTRIVSTEQGEVARDILLEFNELWDSEYTVGFDKFYEVYKERKYGVFASINIIQEVMKITDSKLLGQAIRKSRKELKYTQAYLSDFTGLSVTFISDVERGKPIAEIQKTIKLVNILGTELFVENRGQ